MQLAKVKTEHHDFIIWQYNHNHQHNNFSGSIELPFYSLAEQYNNHGGKLNRPSEKALIAPDFIIEQEWKSKNEVLLDKICLLLIPCPYEKLISIKWVANVFIIFNVHDDDFLNFHYISFKLNTVWTWNKYCLFITTQSMNTNCSLKEGLRWKIIFWYVTQNDGLNRSHN